MSWSIDDSRNKFQFGCECGRSSRTASSATVVKNPNYRGISRELLAQPRAASATRAPFEVIGTPYCGKGEP